MAISTAARRLRDIAHKATDKAMEKLHLSKNSENVPSLQISSPIEGTFIHHTHLTAPNPDASPDYRANINQPETIVPRRFSDLVIHAENWHRQLIGTRHALTTSKEINHGLERQNQIMQLQIERASDIIANNLTLRQENLALKKQAAEQEAVVAILKAAGNKSSESLKTEVEILNFEKAKLEGVMQEVLRDADEHFARLEYLTRSFLETLAGAHGQ